MRRTVVFACVLVGLLFLQTFPSVIAGTNDYLKMTGEPVTGDEADELKLGRGKAGYRITALDEGGEAAKAGLKVGDVLTQMGRSLFREKDDPGQVVDEAVEAAKQSAAKSRTGENTMTIKFIRDGEKETVKLRVIQVGFHPATCPARCGSCQLIVTQALDWLVSKQLEDGHWKAGNEGEIITATTAGLAMLANGTTLDGGRYQEALKKVTNYMMKSWSPEWKSMSDGNGWGFENWHNGLAGIFFAELYAHHPTAEYKERCQAIANKIVEFMEPSGGWCHRSTKLGMKMGYKELIIVSNWNVAALGMFQQLGIKVNKSAVDRAIAYMVKCTSPDGGVGYSDRPGQIYMGQTGRNGGAIWAFERAGAKGHERYPKMVEWFKDNIKIVHEGHGTPVMHYLSSAIASLTIGKDVWQEYWTTYRDKILGLRSDNGSFGPSPSDVSAALGLDMEKDVGRAWTTATYALLFQLADKNELCTFFGRVKKGR